MPSVPLPRQSGKERFAWFSFRWPRTDSIRCFSCGETLLPRAHCPRPHLPCPPAMATTSKVGRFGKANLWIAGSLPNGFAAQFEVGTDHGCRPPFVIFPACGDHDFGLRSLYGLACCLCFQWLIWLRDWGVVRSDFRPSSIRPNGIIIGDFN